MPGVPTLAEAGVKDFDLVAWFGILGTANLPETMAQGFNTAMRRVLEMPEVREKLQAMGTEPMPISTGEFRTLLGKEFTRFETVIRTNNIRPGT